MTGIPDLDHLDHTKMMKPEDIAQAALLPFKVRPEFTSFLTEKFAQNKVCSSHGQPEIPAFHSHQHSK